MDRLAEALPIDVNIIAVFIANGNNPEAPAIC